MIKTRYPTGSKKRFARIYSSSRWRKLRAAIFKERGRKCEKCGSIGPEIQVHHRVPVAQGGDVWKESNLIVLCRSCHLEAHRRIEHAKMPEWKRRLYALVDLPITQPAHGGQTA